jgi:hypothetical protein
MILIVAGNQHQADCIRRQIKLSQNVRVIHPGQCIGSRYDTIIVSDTYRREHYFSDPDTQALMDRWMDDVVRCRLIGPEAELLFL